VADPGLDEISEQISSTADVSPVGRQLAGSQPAHGEVHALCRLVCETSSLRPWRTVICRRPRSPIWTARLWTRWISMRWHGWKAFEKSSSKPVALGPPPVAHRYQADR
jgi:hypothetical protein